MHPDDPRRWLVAWHPAVPHAVIRAKDRDGLREWRDRYWRAFPGPPIILDGSGPDLAVRAADDAPVPGEVADVSTDLGMVLNHDFQLAAERLDGSRDRRKDLRRPTAYKRAAVPFTPGAHVFEDARGELWPVDTPIEPRHGVPNGGPPFYGARSLRWPSYRAKDGAAKARDRVRVEPWPPESACEGHGGVREGGG